MRKWIRAAAAAAACVVVGLAAGPGWADEASDGATEATAAAEDDANMMICTEPSKVTGSRLAKKRVCKTKAQWDALARDGQQPNDRVQALPFATFSETPGN